MKAYACRLLVLAAMLCSSGWLHAQDHEHADSLYEASILDSVEAYFRKHPNKAPKTPKKERKVKLSPAIAVFYSPERSVGLAAGMQGFYKARGFAWNDTSAIPVSNFSIMTTASLTGSASGIVSGSYYTVTSLLNIDYAGCGSFLPINFWGIGFENCDNSSNKSRYDQLAVYLHSDYLFKAGNRVRIGPTAAFDWYDASRFTSDSLITGYEKNYMSFGAGAKFVFDSRDDKLSPQKGFYIALVPTGYIDFRTAEISFRGTMTIDWYAKVWKGGVIALDLYGDYSSRNASWQMWGRLGGDVRLRGYYNGRYLDRNSVFFQTELRQVIYKIHSAVVWAGVGNVFGDISTFDIKHTLPTFGLGYRLTLLGTMFRLDVGFGRNWQWGITAGVGHAF